MLLQPTLEKLKNMKFHGMARAFEEQLNSSDFESLSFAGEHSQILTPCYN